MTVKSTVPKIYFHELSDEEREAIYSSGITVGEFMEKYSQPEWCRLFEALSPLGCWGISYVSKDKEKYCNSSPSPCPYYKKGEVGDNEN